MSSGRARPTVERPVATTGEGRFVGIAHEGIDVFRGIPYAAAPIGDLRWREPQPRPKSSLLHEAAAFGPIPVQKAPGGGLAGRAQSEDCLTLNIWRPTGA